MQPFKLVPSLTSSRIPGRIASPKLRVLRPRGCLDGWAEACCFTGYGWGNDTCVWSNMCCSNLGWRHRSKMFETSCRPYMAQSPTISRKLPQTLRQWARFVSWPFVFNSCLWNLFCQSTCGSVPRCLKQLVLVHMSFPDILPPFAWAGVCRRKVLPRNVALGPGTKKTVQGGKEAKAENPKEWIPQRGFWWLLELMWSCICQVIDYHCC